MKSLNFKHLLFKMVSKEHFLIAKHLSINMTMKNHKNNYLALLYTLFAALYYFRFDGARR